MPRLASGTVYRGAGLSARGIYFYADFCSGFIWGLRQVSNAWRTAPLADVHAQPVTFGEDENGNLLMGDYWSGGVFMITPASAAPIDLSVAASASPDPVLVGFRLTYNIQLTNRGSSAATGGGDRVGSGGYAHANAHQRVDGNGKTDGHCHANQHAHPRADRDAYPDADWLLRGDAGPCTPTTTRTSTPTRTPTPGL